MGNQSLKSKKLQDFLHSKRKKGEIKSYSGMGFVIDTENVKNVLVWNGKDLTQKLYRNVEDDVVFDVFEIDKIVTFENNAWKTYLKSNKTEKDKESYLLNHI